MFNKSGSLELSCGAFAVAVTWLAGIYCILAAGFLLDWEPMIYGCNDLKTLLGTTLGGLVTFNGKYLSHVGVSRAGSS